ncbi:MAG: ABC transporter permease [Clostridiales bacterium]|nr:ABC transporter permease [Clostridiales bacterium]
MKENAAAVRRENPFVRMFKALLNDYSILFVLLALFLILSVFVNSFFRISNITNVLRQVSMVSIVAVGMFFCLVGGGIDLSAGACVGFTGIFFADLIVNRGVNPYVSIVLCLMLGAVLGLLNGVLTSYARLMPFVATVGTMSIAEGLALLWTNSYPVLNLPPEMEYIGRGYLFSVPFPLYIVVVVYVVAYFITEKTRYGRFLYASGGNGDAAYLSGINVKRIRMLSYVVCSITVALAAIILCGRLDSAQPANGKDWGFKAITACVLGGTSMNGGKGKVLGVLLGAIFVGMLSNGMTLLNINSNLQTVANGVVLVIAVGIDVFRTSKANRT